MTATLKVISQNPGIIPPKEYSLNALEIIIGRKHPSAEPVADKIELEVRIGLLEAQISRSHARLLQVNGKWQIVDLSKNGTLVNGIKIQESTPLKPNDTITIGPVNLIFSDK